MAAQRTTIFAEDMNDEMQTLAIETAQDAFQTSFTKGSVYANIAEMIRAAFDKNDTKGWNCIVGRSFGAFVTHKIKTYIYFQVVPNVCILLWKGQ
mmetsp:Transcript_30373/g.62028  ORF Transcript_30373/g.62028 Transcript_30373/m.62028 type:complete len:95 (+) Transcript_30373:135-419(+)|eukprot:CAMPEP_0119543662 /NCGR_PEP_ID=MMETSP1344-20130328/54260_1 /TAXON_ID=236787 /ORGANISM="Florenciella parvula, Strain CCMP2471" /LENGTH=94 /DNA_ID=CAMNT_0007588007 /DNA_START=124 /DNA_END=408 /DNA_ORIENTATION=-